MAKKQPTVWKLEPQTPGKHIVLEAYLKAWLPIMGMRGFNDRILLLDAFAGPGEYQGGEPGSPLIALRTLEEHDAKAKITAEVTFSFIEYDEKRAEHLREMVRPFAERLPASVKINVSQGDCVGIINAGLDRLDQQGKTLAPAFVMLDPFGVKDTPMSLVARLLRQPKCEIYISFMYEAINRHKEAKEFHYLDELFGTTEWREAVDIEDGAERKQAFYDLYERQLRAAGAQYVTYFELFGGEGNRHVYTIFFATKHPLGMARMKEAIWTADRSGGYQFRGRRSGQLSLDVEQLNVGPLQRDMQQAFAGAGWVTIEAIELWAQTDRTDYLPTHVRRALKPMEADGRIEVEVREGKRRAGTFPKGKTRILFKSPA